MTVTINHLTKTFRNITVLEVPSRVMRKFVSVTYEVG